MTVLILGGTSDAIRLCQLVLDHGYKVIYSIKGLVRQPQLNCVIHSGGFGGVKGLVHFILQRGINIILDATHPYSIQMSQHAQLAATHCNLACFHYRRPAWQQHPNDQWILCANIMQLAQLIYSNHQNNSRFFFSIGQLASKLIVDKNPQQHYIIRSAKGISLNLPNKVIWIKSRGPFAIKKERQFFNTYQVDALISKNSGGETTVAKIQVARELQLPVYILQRPNFKSNHPIFNSIETTFCALKKI